MIEVTPLRINNKTAMGLRVELPSSPPFLMVIGQTGFVACGFLNIDAAERLNVAAATVSGVKSFDDVLNATVRAATSKAQAKGVKAGLNVRDALKLFQQR